ncbi:hypothetical protein L208DRAFT_1377288 [Tricholoma matsutake]|nr:hypothetical protein L208DRAFT_1377288 [Tricholoma matsutake 945]
MDYEQETDGDDESSGENLLSNAPNAVQSVQKRQQLVIESSDESDAGTGDNDGGDKDIGADGSMGIDDKNNENEDVVSIEDANNWLSDLPVLLEPILSVGIELTASSLTNPTTGISSAPSPHLPAPAMIHIHAEFSLAQRAKTVDPPMLPSNTASVGIENPFTQGAIATRVGQVHRT